MVNVEAPVVHVAPPAVTVHVEPPPAKAGPKKVYFVDADGNPRGAAEVE